MFLVNLEVSTINYLLERVDLLELQEMIEFVIYVKVRNWVEDDYHYIFNAPLSHDRHVIQ